MSGWIGVDLDGTLAVYDTWNGIEHVGPPVKTMVDRVKGWISRGIEVKIFTARAETPEAIPFIDKWLEDNGIGGLEITNKKDFGMVELWDDRAVRVVTNTGEPCCNG